MEIDKIKALIPEHPFKSSIVAFILGSATTYALVKPRTAPSPPPPMCITQGVGNDATCHRYTVNPYTDTTISQDACLAPHPACP